MGNLIIFRLVSTIKSHERNRF